MRAAPLVAESVSEPQQDGALKSKKPAAGAAGSKLRRMAFSAFSYSPPEGLTLIVGSIGVVGVVIVGVVIVGVVTFVATVVAVLAAVVAVEAEVVAVEEAVVAV